MKAWPILIAALAAAPVSLRAGEDRPRVRHVLLLSVDGMHAVDLAKWIEAHHASTLARLSRHGVTYTEARHHAFGFFSRLARAGDRRHAAQHRRLLRRQLRPDALSARQQLLGQRGHRSRLRRVGRLRRDAALQRHRPEEHAARQGLLGLPPRLSAQLHPGEHDFRSGEGGRRADRLVITTT